MDDKKNNSAMHFFLYLLHFFSLSFVAFGFGGILFQFVNKFFSDPNLYSYQGSFDQGGVKFGIAAIFVAGPIFFFSAHKISKYLLTGEITADSIVRKWLIYIVLFFASATIIGDVITLVVNFLNGDIAARFLLKVLVVLLIAGSIFGYYFWDIRREKIEGKNFKENRIFFATSVAIIFLVFIAGFFVIDSPKVSREKKIDIQTINDMQNINSSVVGYYNQTGNLPDDIDQLKNTEFSPFQTRDSSVEYKKTGESTFQLCTNFSHSNENQENQRYSDPYSNQWQHEKGYICFDRIAIESANLKKTLLKR